MMKTIISHKRNLISMDINEIKTDIALIKKDLSQIEKFFIKIDTSIDSIALISKTIAIQEIMFENLRKRVDIVSEAHENHIKGSEDFRKEVRNQLEEIKTSAIEDRDKRHSELMRSIKEIQTELRNTNKEQDERIESIERWKWYSTGVGAAAIAIGTFLWNVFFG